MDKPLEVFYSYSHKDERMRNELVNHLANLRRMGAINDWHDRKISAGVEWPAKIDEHINSAQLILLLISSSFMASDYCSGIEMSRAIERHEAKEARVIPVLLRDVDWTGAPFAKLQPLPSNGKPIANWPNRDKAFADVVRGIRTAIDELNQIYSHGAVELREHQRSLLKKVQWVLVLSATIDEVDMPVAEAIVQHLQLLSGDSNITLVKVEPGSVRLILESSRETYEVTKKFLASEETSELLSFKVQKIYNNSAILLLVHEKDANYGVQLQQYLLNNGVESSISRADNLEIFDAEAGRAKRIIIIYGDVDVRWVSARLQFIFKLGIEKDLPPKDLWVYLAPPVKLIPTFRGFESVRILGDSETFDPLALGPSLGLLLT